MSHRRTLIGILLLISVVCAGVFSTSSVTTGAAKTRSASPINRIVFIIKENRSFDSMFGTFPGANGATTYVDANGVVQPLTHQADKLAGDVGHGHIDAVKAYNNGLMDKFYTESAAIQNGVDVADSQFYQTDIPNYWAYAQKFGLADNFYSNVMTSSFPNHLFTVAGQGANTDNIPNGNNWGCDAKAGNTVEVRSPQNVVSYVYPCFNIPSLTDSLNAIGVSWKYYAPPAGVNGYQWSALDAISQVRNGPQWATNVAKANTFTGDAGAGKLPTVSWLVAPMAYSDHPPVSECQSENWTVQQINSIMENPSEWYHTAIVLTWDDWGGFYDHVAPAKVNNTTIENGFRVPMIMISPYTKPGFIDHTSYTFNSVLKFIEGTTGAAQVNYREGTSNNISNMLNLSQPPLPPTILPVRTCP